MVSVTTTAFAPVQANAMNGAVAEMATPDGAEGRDGVDAASENAETTRWRASAGFDAGRSGASVITCGCCRVADVLPVAPNDCPPNAEPVLVSLTPTPGDVSTAQAKFASCEVALA